MASKTEDDRGLRLAVRYLVLILVAIIFIFPLLFMVMSSLKPQAQLLNDTSSLRAFLPVGDISLDNYRDAFRRAPVATLMTVPAARLPERAVVVGRAGAGVTASPSF